MYKKRPHLMVAIIMMSFLTMVGVFSIVGQAWANYGDNILTMGSRGTYVANLQKDLSDLGFNTRGIDGIFGSKTKEAVLSFQKNQGISADGVVGAQTKKVLGESVKQTATSYTVKSGDSMFKIAQQYGITIEQLMQANNKTSYIIYPGESLVITGKSTSGQPSTSSTAEAADWWTVVSQVFARGDVATVTDVQTGISYQVLRSGGSNHADCQPLTWSDTEKMKKIYGGSWSWARRAILVKVDGRTFAASQNGMPHGGQTIYNNNFNGHFCIHFKNSRTHGTNRVDAAHQAAVTKAAAK